MPAWGCRPGRGSLRRCLLHYWPPVWLAFVARSNRGRRGFGGLNSSPGPPRCGFGYSAFVQKLSEKTIGRLPPRP